MEGVYVVSFIAWKRRGDGYRPVMVDAGVSGVFPTKESAEAFIFGTWPDAAYNSENDRYYVDRLGVYYRVYGICFYDIHTES